MTKHKKKKAKNAPQGAGGLRLHESPGGEELISDSELPDLREFLEANPELGASMIEAMTAWRDDFIAEHGREPGDQDFEAHIAGIFPDPDEDDGADASATGQDATALVNRCAWCGQALPEEAERCGMGLMLPPGLRKSQAGRPVLTLEFRSLGKTVRAPRVGPGSPAARDGNDAMVVFCCENCGQEFRAAYMMARAKGELR